MSIMPIAPIAPIAIDGVAQVGNPTVASGARAAGDGGAGFANIFVDALDNLSSAHQVADQLALQAATGDLQAVQDYVIASTEAQLMTDLVVTVRNRAVEAFNDVMRMQV